MLGTFGGALEARHIDASDGRLTADVRGEVETDEGVLVIRRVHVAMRLVADEAVRDTVDGTRDLRDEVPSLPDPAPRDQPVVVRGARDTRRGSGRRHLTTRNCPVRTAIDAI